MNILKKTTLVLVASLLVSSLFLFGLFWSVHQVVGSPGTVKQALAKSGIYQTAVNDTLQQSLKDQSKGEGGGGAGDLPLGNADVRAVIGSALPPAFLQTQIEQILDASYAWVQGKSPSLAFSVDLTAAKAKLADGMATYVTNRLSQLPVCAPGQAPVSGDVDYFNATCIPAGFNPAVAGEKTKQDLLSGDFLKDPKLTASSIKNNKGETLDQQLKRVPDTYHKAKMAIYGLGLLSLLLGLGVVFLSSTWRTGLHKLGVTFISVGTLSTLLGWAVGASTQIASTKLAQNGQLTEPLQKSGLELAKILTGDLRNWWMGYGITLIVLGIGALIGLHLTRPAADKKAEAFLHENEHAIGNEKLLKGVGEIADKPQKTETKKETKEK